MSDHKTNPADFDWQSFQNHFQQMNPFEQSNATPYPGDKTWIQEYVNGVLENALPRHGTKGKKTKGKLQTNVFETHDFVITRVHVPDTVDDQNLKVNFAVNQIKLEGMPEGYESVIRLPVNGRWNGSKAIFRDGVLEIRIPKETNEIYRKIDIKYY